MGLMCMPQALGFLCVRADGEDGLQFPVIPIAKLGQQGSDSEAAITFPMQSIVQVLIRQEQSAHSRWKYPAL